MREFIPVSAPLLDHEDERSVVNAIRKSQISGTSGIVGEFEANFAGFVGKKFGIAVSNGTVALQLALRVIEVGPGDEVVIPSFTIVSVLQAVIKTGATPVFVDCDSETWNSGPDDILNAITPRTKAVIIVHTYGLPVDMERVITQLEGSGVVVIEDASEAHGLKYKEKMCGSFGLMSIFSFYANKHITCGEGGMILTDSPALAKQLKFISNLAMDSKRRFLHTEFGENFRLSGLQAALGISQLKKIDRIRGIKQAIAAEYTSRLSNLQSISLPIPKLKYATNDYWVYGIVPRVSSMQSREIQSDLEAFGIETRPFFYPLHLQPCYSVQPSEHNLLPNSSHIGERGFYLPTPLDLTLQEIEFITAKLRALI